MEGISFFAIVETSHIKVPYRFTKREKKKQQIAKAKRKGWPLISEYKPINFKEAIKIREVVEVYPEGRFCEAKIVK